MECMLFSFENRAHALGGVTDEHLQLNRVCCFPTQAVFPEGFPFHQFNNDTATERFSVNNINTIKWHMSKV